MFVHKSSSDVDAKRTASALDSLQLLVAELTIILAAAMLPPQNLKGSWL